MACIAEPCVSYSVPAIVAPCRQIVLVQPQVAEQTAVRGRIRQRMVDLLGDDAVLAVPSAASAALPKGMDGPGLDECRQRAITIMAVAGLAGLPQVADVSMMFGTV